MHQQREMVIPYVDPVEGFRGWAAFHGDTNPLAAGGFRVQAGLTEETVRSLARTMSLKQNLLGLSVDGAKVGIDYSPLAPGKHDAMKRFIRFLRPQLLTRLSIGPDMGTTWDEVEGIAHEVGLPSVKVAIARAQGLDHNDFLGRLHLLDFRLDGLTLAQRRAGHALAHAALAAAGYVGVARDRLRVGVQGFGTLGRGAACSLQKEGAVLVAVADEHGCVIDEQGLDLYALLATPQGEPIRGGTSATAGKPGSLFDTPLDVVILAACEDALPVKQAQNVPVRAVVVGANLGLPTAAEALLHDRKVVVVPDFIGGCGGPASMDALFGSPIPPTPQQVLESIGTRVHEVVERVLQNSAATGMAPRQAALAFCAEAPRGSRARPYGSWAKARTAPGSDPHAETAHHWASP